MTTGVAAPSSKPGISLLSAPDVLPSFARSVTVSFEPDATFEGVELPGDLERAVATRKRQFLAGRYCAREALARLGEPAPGVGRGRAGEPQWPSPVTGSIAHTGHVAMAAVARRSDARSLGIDVEALVPGTEAHRFARIVMHPSEAGLGGAALDDAVRAVLVFSAKESIFKCLYPLTRVRFYYQDATLHRIDAASGTFRATLLKDLGSGCPAGMPIEGRFAIGERLVHTGVWAAPER